MTRIVAGQAGGRRLVVPSGRAVRPTSDRVREALASALESRLGSLTGLRVLDLFAGSGAVGLELLSRGAAAATLVESDPAALAALRSNVAALGLPGATVVPGRAEAFVPVPGQEPDITVLDPPYALDVDPFLRVAGAYTRRVIVVERATRSPEPVWPEGFLAGRARKYGDTTLWYGWRS